MRSANFAMVRSSCCATRSTGSIVKGTESSNEANCLCVFRMCRRSSVGALAIVIAAVPSAQAHIRGGHGRGMRAATGRVLTALNPLRNWLPFGSTFGRDHRLGPFRVDDADSGRYMGDEGDEGDEGGGGFVFTHTSTNGGKAMAFASTGSASCSATSESFTFSDSESVVIDAGALLPLTPAHTAATGCAIPQPWAIRSPESYRVLPSPV